ncbi:hypothetical protein J7438_13930 [Thalassotalea sp. G20_0]|uniref:hypothetical protein n=1 Tax=Thalassotalea sp. G20_0 TaxID=2821093 RepID=UPI001ADB5D7A|nr:hypothetical protein [Thalassotalea sp. G20_0]MBO9495177.1 hypothetical protein [Thalassotalea sp. G20_0]
MQGGILKATTSTCSHPKPAGGQQAGSSRIPGGSRSKFNGKKVSNHQSRTGTAITLDDGRRIEDAFWKKKPLQGRQINTADVLTAYGKDKTSFRSGFFLQQLCLQNIRHGNSKVTPDQVIRELNRKPGRNDKCQIAIARFKEECCLTGLRLNGRLVTPETVIKDFPESREGKLGMARFKEHCCLKGLPLRGQKISPDTVAKDFQAINATMELARFKAECCLRGLRLNGQPVTPDEVIRDFPDNLMGKLGLARFKEQCCQKGLALNGQQITPDEVVKDFPDSLKGQLGLARFKADCCLKGKMMNGQPVTPDEVVKAFPASQEGKLGLAIFKEKCCLTELPLNGHQVRPEAVAQGYQAVNAKLKLSYFKKECCLRGLTLNGQQVTPDEVVREYQAAKATMLLAHFKMECCLRGLVLHGQQVLPEVVVKDYRAANALLGLARFKEKCCLRGLALNGQQITPDEVVKDYQVAKADAEQARCNTEARQGGAMNDQQVEYQATKAPLELVRFKAECCLRGWSLNGQQVIPAAVVKGFQAIKAPLELARFKENCCLKALAVNGRPVTTEEVVKGYKEAKAPLELARFKAECCLKGLALNGQQVTTDEVVKEFKTAKAPLELARFKADCCLLGLLLHGEPVTPDEVVRDFPDSREGRLGLGRFKADCCLKGLVLRGRKVTPDEVVKSFPDSPEGSLAIARFKEMCCLMELPLNGQQITPDAVVKSFPSSSDGRMGLARFKEQCCLRGLMLQGQQVVPDEVANDFPDSREGKLAMVRFQGECCLKGLALNRRQVTPGAVVKDFESGGWLLESAIFQTRLALNARELNGSCLDNPQVLAAFNEAPGDHSSRQAEYLMQRLKQRQWFDETNEAQAIIQQAWQILNSAPVKKDEQHRLQCILKFTAMQYELLIDQQRVSAEEVLQSITTLRNSFKNKRTHFFFLAYCYINRQSIDGQTIHRSHVLECLQDFPERSKLRHALGYWFERFSPEANIMNEFLFKQERAAAPRRNSPHRYAVSAVQTCQAGEYRNETENTSATQAVANSAAQAPKQWSIEPGFLNRHPQLNALTLQTLELIQEINGSYSHPPILITGSYARFLQNRCSSFNDIDIICTAAEPARTLFDQLQALNTNRAAEIPKNIVIWSIPGCQEIKLPKAYNLHLKDGDLGMKAMGIQVSIDVRVTDGNTSRCAVQVPGVERLVWCLSFAEETRLLNNTLEYLAKNIDPLTRQLQKGEFFYLPRTILFNTPQNIGERIYGLLMRSLLTLHKARQFIDLHSEDKPGTPIQINLLQEQRQRLYILTANLQTKLSGHVCRSDFEQRVNNWLSTAHHVNEYEFKRRDFIKALLAMMQPE